MAKASARGKGSKSKTRAVSKKTIKPKPKKGATVKIAQLSGRPVKKAAAARGGKASGVVAKVSVKPAPAPPPEKPPRVLRESKSTAAALSQLEKSIKLIFQKNFNKARAELESLIENYPSQAEIAARARSYIQICRREDALRQRTAPTNDELYSLGVLEHNRGNFDTAIACFHQSLEKKPGADYIYYSLAASLAVKGETAAAIENLKRAIELNEDNRVYAKNDSDFASLHRHRDFAMMVRLEPSRAAGHPLS